MRPRYVLLFPSVDPFEWLDVWHVTEAELLLLEHLSLWVSRSPGATLSPFVIIGPDGALLGTADQA